MVKSDSYSNPRFFFNGTFRPDDFAKKATVSEKPLQPPSLRPWPSLVPEQDVTHHLLMKAVNLAQSIITSREGIDAMAALALKLNEIAPNDIVVDGSENDGGLAQAYRTEGWEYDVARNFAQSLMASWPDVMVDEEMQWPTNFANIERRSWSGEFDPRKFLIRLNAPRIQMMFRCDAKEIYYYVFQLIITLVHEVGGHLFVTYLTYGRSQTPREVRHPNYYPGVYECAPESGRYLEMMLFGGALIFAGDGSERFRQCGIPWVVAEDGLARPVEPSTIQNLTKGRFKFPLPVQRRTVRYFRLPFLCGVDRDLLERIADQETKAQKDDTASAMNKGMPRSSIMPTNTKYNQLEKVAVLEDPVMMSACDCPG